jgi:Putative prokaryotic signal transducing protein
MSMCVNATYGRMHKFDEYGQQPAFLTATYAGCMAYRLLTARPEMEAHVLAGALLAEGITAVLERDPLGAVYRLTFGAFATRVLVLDDDYDQALALLQSVEASER